MTDLSIVMWVLAMVLFSYLSGHTKRTWRMWLYMAAAMSSGVMWVRQIPDDLWRVIGLVVVIASAIGIGFVGNLTRED